MPRVLRGLHIHRVDRCAVPVNQEAQIVLFKAVDTATKDPESGPSVGNNTGETMTIDMDALDPAVREHIEGLEKTIADAAAPDDDAVAEAVEKALGDMTPEQVAEKFDGVQVAEVKDPEPDLDEIMKGLPPELQEKLQKGEDALAKAEKLEKAERQRHFLDIAKGMSGLTEKPDTIGEVLDTVAKATGGEDSDGFKAVQQVLKAASAQAEEALTVLGKGKGHSEDGPTADDRYAALEEIDELAKAAVAKGDYPTTQQAKVALRKSHSELFETAHKGL